MTTMTCRTCDKPTSSEYCSQTCEGMDRFPAPRCDQERATPMTTDNPDGVQRLKVNDHCRIMTSDKHRCTDVILVNVCRVEHRDGYTVIVSTDDAGRKHHVYVHHGLSEVPQ